MISKEERWIQLDPPEAIAGWHVGMAWSLPEEGTLARVTAVGRCGGRNAREKKEVIKQETKVEKAKNSL